MGKLVLVLALSLFNAHAAFAGTCPGAGPEGVGGSWGVADPIVADTCGPNNTTPPTPRGPGPQGTDSSSGIVNTVETKTTAPVIEDVYDLSGQGGGNASKVAGNTTEVSSLDSGNGSGTTGSSVQIRVPSGGDARTAQ